MLGYPTHYGQTECLTLASQPEFAAKRVGYLGAMLLLDARADIAVMITNCLQRDLGSGNRFIVGLALCTLARCNHTRALSPAPVLPCPN